MSSGNEQTQVSIEGVSKMGADLQRQHLPAQLQLLVG